jgi:hypothetical protein
VTGSGLTKEQAYDLILQHAIKAIKDVESTKTDGKKILIGGFVAHTIWESSMLEYLLQNSPAMNQLDFISYHDYGNTEPSWGSYKDMLAKYGKSNIPIYVTEWNYNSSETTTSPYNTSTLAISYTGSKFVDFMKMGVQVADYFALTPLDTTKPNNGEGLMGFYRWNDLTSTASLLPQVKTWRLMSKTLGLGTGVSKIMSTTNNGVNAVGFINSIGKYGAVAVNSDAVEKVATIQLSNIPLSTSAVNFYIADGKRDGFTIIENRTINNVNGNATIQVKIPPQAILGMLY